jgi:hypothetical protein
MRGFRVRSWGAGWGEMDRGRVRVHDGTRQTRKDYNDTVRVWLISARPFSTVQ